MATTLFTPIVDVLPGKYNIVHAEGTQNPTPIKEFSINSSNNWSGLSAANDTISEQRQSNFMRFKRTDQHNAAIGFKGPDVQGLTSIEMKVRFSTQRPQSMSFSGMFYNFDWQCWSFGGNTPEPGFNHSVKPNTQGQWQIFKVIVDQAHNKTSYYLNDVKVGEKDSRTAPLRGIGAAGSEYQNVVNQGFPLNTILDVEYVKYTQVGEKDTTAPDAPKVNKVTDQDTKVTGTGEKGATVKVVVDGKEIGTGKVDDQGNYTVDIPKQPGGKEIVVTLTDAAGNTSKPTKTTVEAKDV
ncbi:Ig-like domain-containing protein, partial [Bacillus cereus]|uniref:Ig-like domain-containing protein n=1 Tax=Bacillus cereus TaxID=1396 RepID=UPI001E5721F8